MGQWAVVCFVLLASASCLHAANLCNRPLFGISSRWVRANFTIWSQEGDDPAHFRASVEVTVPALATYLDLMKVAAVKDARFQFVSLNNHVGHNVYVTTINGLSEDVSAMRFWMLYLLPGAPDPASPPDNSLLTPRTVDGMTVQEGDNILFWLHQFIWTP